jgi:hypothetical protein
VIRAKERAAKAALLLILLTTFACHRMRNRDPEPKRDINVVLRENDRRLLAIPGVVGVYIGLASDQEAPCLRVMLVRDTPELRNAIPRKIDGYLVETEVTGEIRPLQAR